MDIKPQPHYPFQFIQADAMSFRFSHTAEFVGGSRDHWPEICDSCGLSWDNHFDFVWASPPCQAFCDLKDMHNAKHHDDLLTPIRERLIGYGGPYAIENVPGAPLGRGSLKLCGSMFGLGTADAELRRHRYFETTFHLISPPCVHGRKNRVIGVYGGHGRDCRRKINTQDFSTSDRRAAMGIDWMTGTELSQAIPPAYSEFIGKAAMTQLRP